MKRKTTTRNALFTSVLSLLLCVSMLVGTTFAWFTDEVKSGTNVIAAGNLDVDVFTADGKSIQDQKSLFDEIDLWEPGVFAYENLTVENLGSLALKYQMSINFDNATTNANGDTLAKVLKVGFVKDGIKSTTREGALAEVTAWQPLESFVQSGKLLPEDYKGEPVEGASEISETFGLVIYWEPSDIDNEFNMNNKNQGKVMSIDLGIKLLATQLNAESDSYDETYDEDAWHPDMFVTTAAELAKAIEEVKDGGIIALSDNLTFEQADATDNGNALFYDGDKSFTIDLNGFTLSGDTSNVVIRIQKAAGAENTITIKNGSVIAGENCWSAISVGSSANTETNVELIDLKIEANKRNDMAVRARPGAVITMTDCEVKANAYGGGVCAGGGEVTMNNVTINQFGLDASAPWNSAAFGVNGGGKMTINSGNYYATPKTAADGNNQGTSHGSFTGIIMNSGGTLIINGGTFTNDNFGDNALATAARGVIEADTGAVVEINGGTFNGLKSILAMTNNLGDASRNPSATISGGVFSADPTISGLHASNLIKIADGYKVVENNGIYVIAPENIDKVIMTAADLLALSAKRIEGTYALMADIDLGGADFSAMVVNYNKTATFLGNGYTISNANIISGADDNTTGQASMFYGYEGSTLNVSNLTLKNITVTSDKDGNGYAAAVIGYGQGNAVLNNVDVVNAAINGEKSSGLLVGHVTPTQTLTAIDCDLSGTVTLMESANEPNGHYAGKLFGTIAGNVALNNVTYNATIDGSLHANNIGDLYGRKTSTGVLTIDGAIPATTTEQLIDAIKNAPVGQTTTIVLTNSTYAGDINITLAAMGKQGGDVVIKAAKGVKPVITGTVTLGYRDQGTGAAMWDANVTFEGITFDHAEAQNHCINVHDVKSLTLKKCTIIGDGEYGIGSPRGNGTGPSLITECTFVNAAIQGYGNFCSGLVIDQCIFDNSRINIGAGNGVTVQGCTFDCTLTDANNGDSFYAIRTSTTGTPITVKDCKINVDSTVNGTAAPASGKAFAILHNRHGSKAWTIENVKVTLTDAALAQPELKVVVTAGGAMNTTNLTVNGVQQ